MEDDDGKTPLDLAQQENREECVKLLDWWSKNSKDSKPSTPVSNHRKSDHQFSVQQQNTVIFNYPSPTSSPAYKPKYFPSPIRDSPTSPFSPSSGGSRRTPISAASGSFSRLNSSSSRRILRYDEPRSIKEETTDGNCFGKCDSTAELRFEKLPSTPTSEIKTSHIIVEKSVEKDRRSSRGLPSISEVKTSHIVEKSAEKDRRSSKGHTEKEEIPVSESEATNGTQKETEIVDVIHRLSLLDDGLESFTQKLNETLNLDDSTQREALAALEMTIAEENREIDPRRLSECNKLTDAELRRQATNQGIDVGPITPGTRFLYVRQLATLLSSNKVAGVQTSKCYILHLGSNLNIFNFRVLDGIAKSD